MIIGRHEEKKQLEKVYASKKAEFVAIYGRRRIGKTYLIREFFKEKQGKLLYVSGLQNGNMTKQLKKFADALSETFFDEAPLGDIKNWDVAFANLTKQITKSKEKIIIFLDELPWLATRKSGLLEEIDHYWNSKWSSLPNVILVVCGSSASWIINKIIHNKGGLHNRVTCKIKLLPFCLGEVRDYFSQIGMKLNDSHVLALYMAAGGVPYYLSYVEKGKTSDQNIQTLYFSKNAPLKDEFTLLFESLFENADAYIELIRLIADKRKGVQREELKKRSKLSSGGGRLTKRLLDLCEAGFIESYVPWGRTHGEYYKLIDEFCYFYLRWVEPHRSKKFTMDYWMNQLRKPEYQVWAGYAFEAICMKHVDKIIHALDIKTSGNISAWQYIPRSKTGKGAQIDLVIDRVDKAITLCEIKYSDHLFEIDKKYAGILENKMKVFQEKTNTTKQLFLAMVCANGLKQNSYANECVDGVVSSKDLF